MAESGEKEIWAIHHRFEEDSMTYLVDMKRVDIESPDVADVLRNGKDYGSLSYDEAEFLWDIKEEPPQLVEKIYCLEIC